MLIPACTVIYTTKSALKNLCFKKRDRSLTPMKKGLYSHYNLLILPIPVYIRSDPVEIRISVPSKREESFYSCTYQNVLRVIVIPLLKPYGKL